MEPSRKVFALIIALAVAFSVIRAQHGPARDHAATPERAREIYAALGGRTGSVPIVAFVTAWCPHCRSLEAWLSAQGIEHVLADIENDEQAGRFFMELAGSGAGVPQTLVGPYLVAGNDPGGIQAARIEQERVYTSPGSQTSPNESSPPAGL